MPGHHDGWGLLVPTQKSASVLGAVTAEEIGYTHQDDGGGTRMNCVVWGLVLKV